MTQTSSADKFAQHQASLEAAAQEREAQKAAKQAEEQRMLEARKNPVPFDRKQQTDFRSVYAEKRVQEQAAAAAAKQAQIDSITPRDIYMSMQTPQKRKEIAAWEQVRGLKWPLPSGFGEQVLAAKAE